VFWFSILSSWFSRRPKSGCPDFPVLVFSATKKWVSWLSPRRPISGCPQFPQFPSLNGGSFPQLLIDPWFWNNGFPIHSKSLSISSQRMGVLKFRHLKPKNGCPQIPFLKFRSNLATLHHNKKIALCFLLFSLNLRPNTLHLRLGQLFNAYSPHILFFLNKKNGPAVGLNVPAFTLESFTLFIA